MADDSRGGQQGLVEFLRALASIRAKRVHRLDQYEAVLWLDDLPTDGECFSRHRDPAPDGDQGLWVGVEKRTEPPFPDIPGLCADWVGRIDISNDEEPPGLLASIEGKRPTRA